MKQYEGMFILKPDLDKAGVDKVLAQIEELVTKNKGSIAEAKEMGKTRFSFPIKKYKDGIYHLFKFSIQAEAVSSMKKSLSLNDSILRLLIVET